MANKKTARERLESLYDAVGESICNASDEEILEDLRQEGIDIKVESARIRTMLLDTVKSYKQSRRRTYD